MNIDKSVKHPALHYLGGKWIMAKTIISHFPEHKIYVEPFGGGASVLLRKPRSELEVWNDLDKNLFNLFNVIRNKYEEFKRACELTLYSESEFKFAFNTMNDGDEVERARKFAFFSIAAFGSSSKISTRGFRIVKPPKQANIRIKNLPRTWANYAENIDALHARLRDVLILNRDAFSIFEKYDSEETLWYVDPPYVLSSRRTPQCAAYNHELDDESHVKLLETLKNLKGAVILSGYDNDIYRDILGGWKVETKKSRNMAVSPATEYLWFNERIAA